MDLKQHKFRVIREKVAYKFLVLFIIFDETRIVREKPIYHYI